jgi:prepilin-type N-terminal cleavage/methylation domain-containing protein
MALQCVVIHSDGVADRKDGVSAMQRAFTLVEISSVIVVVGIAGALAASTMSDQIQDARANAAPDAVLEDMREEFRLAREQMQALKISTVGDVGVDGAASVRFARVADCTSNGSSTTLSENIVSYSDARVVLVPGTLCLSPDGEALSLHEQTPLVVVTATLSGDRQTLSALRVDPVGFSEAGSRQDTKRAIGDLVGALQVQGLGALVHPTQDVGVFPVIEHPAEGEGANCEDLGTCQRVDP